ncbi:MAG: response regulator [Sandaracinaceae bacterium]|nr:response regulator [Sandaracinaceae bacterium]
MTRVLVIDDDATALEVIRAVLGGAGLVVFTSASPIGATHTIRAERIDCVVCDLEMPAMRGEAFAKLFRKTRLFDRVKLVLVSAAPESDLLAVEQSGVADAVLHKSQLAARLVPLLRRLMAGSRP